MPRIENKNLKIFAQGAANNGVFGSAADNTKILSSDVDVLQSKPAWGLGWLEAVIGTRKFPTLEEFQTCTYVSTHQIAYLLQEGIPEWNAGKVYYQKSIVKRTGTYEIYGSLTDDNQGNAVTDDENWQFLQDLALTAIPDATTSVKGIAMLAVIADIISGNSDKIVTPDLLSLYGFRTGDWKGTTGSSLQTGWIWAAGNIGNASSGATNRANADCEALFKFYWDDAAYNYAGTTATGAALQVRDSSGTAVSKGVSADADWAANRRIDVPDFRDRVPAGRGNMVGSAGRLSGQPNGVNGNGLGNAGGEETASAVLTIPRDGWGTAGGTPGTIAQGRLVVGSGNPELKEELESLRAAGGNRSSNATMNTVQPTIITNIVIKL